MHLKLGYLARPGAGGRSAFVADSDYGNDVDLDALGRGWLRLPLDPAAAARWGHSAKPPVTRLRLTRFSDVPDRTGAAGPGGSPARSTRSTRAVSPTRTGMEIGDLPGIRDHLDYLNDGNGRLAGCVGADLAVSVLPVAHGRLRLRHLGLHRRRPRSSVRSGDFDDLLKWRPTTAASRS